MTDISDQAELGHLFMVGIPGTEIDDSTLSLISENRIHNFILFRRNVVDKKQLKKLCSDLHNACYEANLPAPLISIDQEGGQVARLPPPFTVFPEPRFLAEDPEPQSVLEEYARVCSKELREVGINMNLAPVLDVCPSGAGLFMERRCLGDSHKTVAKLGCIVIDHLQKGGVAACAKHFPGLGTADLDPHLELPIVEKSLAYFHEVELAPFLQAINEGVAAVMTSHALYTHIDSDFPGTLSRRVIYELLREKSKFDGLIITDDMEMGAIENFMSFPKASLKAVQAGADLLLICHDHNKVRSAYSELQTALSEEKLPPHVVSDSLKRQAEVIKRFGL